MAIERDLAKEHIHSLPAIKDVLLNTAGFPFGAPNPVIDTRDEYQNVLYHVDDIVTDWNGYQSYLASNSPETKPRMLFISHDMSEIENITLMALGGVVKAMNGSAHYLLVNPENTNEIDRVIEEFNPEWIGFSLYTGLTDYIFDWLRKYKIAKAERVFGKKYSDFEQADNALKGLVNESGNGPAISGSEVNYAPIIIGGHFNNNDYRSSFDGGAEYSIRGKGVNLLVDVLQKRFQPGIYHDPVSFPNIPEFDREGFYRDTFAFSDAMKQYALSPVKSVLTALGCAYQCTYCYIGSLIENQEDAYKGTGIRPPSIIQDRPMETVLNEGIEIKRLDEVYGVSTAAVFDQADISLNNIGWWEELRPLWMEKVGIPFYIQARPAMLARQSGIRRLQVVSQDNLIAGVSMAIESGDEDVRKLLLKRMEPNHVILSALKNVKSFGLPVRTQVITGLPVLRPLTDPEMDIGLVGPDGKEHYYDDPLDETLKALELICESELFGAEDYYWNSLYSPFSGTPLGDYSDRSGFHEDIEGSKESAYMFTTEAGLTCFSPETARKQVGYHRTVNFFAHLANGADMMRSFLDSDNEFNIEKYASFIWDNRGYFDVPNRYSRFGLIPNPTNEMLFSFFEHAYEASGDSAFKDLNKHLTPYYEVMLDGLVLAAKIAVRYHAARGEGREFDLDDLANVERKHYYDNSYNMAYLPDEYEEYLRVYVHDSRTRAERPERVMVEIVHP